MRCCVPNNAHGDHRSKDEEGDKESDADVDGYGDEAEAAAPIGEYLVGDNLYGGSGDAVTGDGGELPAEMNGEDPYSEDMLMDTSINT